VNFAVLQIIVAGSLAAVGMVVRQLPSSAFQSVSDYRDQMSIIHDRYDPALGTAVVDLLERLQVFQIFRSTWFSVSLVLLLVSIVVCTLDRTPRLWRQSREIRVVQPDAFFDPRLPDRAAVMGMADVDVAEVMRRHRFKVREEEAGGVRYLYGDRNQYTRMATLLTHLGLILFLVAAGVTSRLGSEAGLVLGAGETAPVQSIGTPGLLSLKSFGFQAPRNPDGSFADFTTDLAVYRQGQLLARKIIRVNDPLSVAGFTFHQNGFRPAPDLVIRDVTGAVLWSGPVPLLRQAAGMPFDEMTVPGTDVGLDLLLTDSPAQGVLFVPYRAAGQNPDGSPSIQTLAPFFLAPAATGRSPDATFSVELKDIGGATILIAKQDPGQGLVWLAFGSLLAGLLISFYLPRRRVWVRLDDRSGLQIVGRADRYVDFEREFGRFLSDLVAARVPQSNPALPSSATQ
jgi:cytochrome c biogenesis protein